MQGKCNPFFSVICVQKWLENNLRRSKENLWYYLITKQEARFLKRLQLTLKIYEGKSLTIHSTTTKGDGSTSPERYENKSNQYNAWNLKADTLKEELMIWHLSYFTFHFVNCKPCRLNVLSNNFTLYSNLLEFLMLINYAKLGQVRILTLPL